jgi:hypothetical protein
MRCECKRVRIESVLQWWHLCRSSERISVFLQYHLLQWHKLRATYKQMSGRYAVSQRRHMQRWHRPAAYHLRMSVWLHGHTLRDRGAHVRELAMHEWRNVHRERPWTI